MHRQSGRFSIWGVRNSGPSLCTVPTIDVSVKQLPGGKFFQATLALRQSIH